MRHPGSPRDRFLAEHAEPVEELVPVVIAAPDKGEIELPGIGHVDRDVDQVLPDPPEAEGRAGRFGSTNDEVHHQHGGDEELEERSTEIVQGLPERAKEQVSELVEREIRKIHETPGRRPGAQPHRPPQQQCQQRRAGPVDTSIVDHETTSHHGSPAVNRPAPPVWIKGILAIPRSSFYTEIQFQQIKKRRGNAQTHHTNRPLGTASVFNGRLWAVYSDSLRRTADSDCHLHTCPTHADQNLHTCSTHADCHLHSCSAHSDRNQHAHPADSDDHSHTCPTNADTDIDPDPDPHRTHGNGWIGNPDPGQRAVGHGDLHRVPHPDRHDPAAPPDPLRQGRAGARPNRTGILTAEA